MFGTNVDVGRGMSDLTVKYLVQDGTYSVIDRKAMDKILAEQNFSNSDRANPNSAAKLGKILGVDAIIVGSITQFGNETKNTNIGGAGGNWGGYGLGNVGQKKSKAIVAVDARIINIDTAEIMGVASGKGESSRESTSLLGGGGNWHGFGGGSADFGSSDFQQTIIGEAVNLAVKDLSAGLIADNTKLEARTIKVEGLVAAVDGGQIVLNVGGKAGLKVGDQLNVERITREIKDPDHGRGDPQDELDGWRDQVDGCGRRVLRVGTAGVGIWLQGRGRGEDRYRIGERPYRSNRYQDHVSTNGIAGASLQSQPRRFCVCGRRHSVSGQVRLKYRCQLPAIRSW